MLMLTCERGGVYKSPMKKLNLEDTRTRKYGCLYRLCGYLKKTNEGSLNILNGIHNYRMENHWMETNLVVKEPTTKGKYSFINISDLNVGES